MRSLLVAWMLCLAGCAGHGTRWKAGAGITAAGLAPIAVGTPLVFGAVPGVSLFAEHNSLGQFAWTFGVTSMALGALATAIVGPLTWIRGALEDSHYLRPDP